MADKIPIASAVLASVINASSQARAASEQTSLAIAPMQSADTLGAFARHAIDGFSAPVPEAVQLANAESMSIAAGLMKPEDRLKFHDALFSAEFAR